MTGPFRSRGPRPLSEILGALMEARGYGRLKGRRELEAAWLAAAGEAIGRQTRVGGLRHGVLTITVNHSALLDELAGYRKMELLKALHQAAPSSSIRDLRFRIGPLAERE